MSRRLIAAAATAALALGLAACGEGGDGPQIEPPPEVDVGQGASDGGSDEASPSDEGGEPGADDGSTEAAPDIPAPDPADFPGMDENTAEGAEQAVRFYFANVYWGYQTGDSSKARPMYAESCAACNVFTNQINDLSKGATWGPVEVDDFGIENYESESFDYEIGYIFTVGDHDAPAVSTGEMVPVDAVDYTAVVGVQWIEGSWVVADMSFQESGSE